MMKTPDRIWLIEDYEDSDCIIWDGSQPVNNDDGVEYVKVDKPLKENLINQPHKLKLHEKINNVDNDSHFRIMRVPGGWIYRFFEPQYIAHNTVASYVVDSVFVPFNSEFNVNTKGSE